MPQRSHQIIKILLLPFQFIGANLFSFIKLLCSSVGHPQINKGDKFLTIVDIEKTGLIHYKATFTGGFNCLIPKGTVLLALSNSERISFGFGCVPENEEEFGRMHLPEVQRNDKKYAGYSFVFKYKEIGKRLKKI